MMKLLKSAVARANARARFRRDYQTLLEFDDRMLADVGLQRSQVRERVLSKF
jgi:uncharacterized protein YjiS (DUF1127 family)